MMTMLAMMTWGQWVLGLVLGGVCSFLILVILLQRGRGGGLAGAFGGAGGSSAFGAKTGDVFTWITVVVAGAFVVLSVAANFVFDPTRRGTTSAQAEEVQSPSTGESTEPILITPTEVVPGDGAPLEPGSGTVVPIENLGTVPVESKPSPAPVDAQPPGATQPSESPPENQTHDPDAESGSLNKPDESRPTDIPVGDAGNSTGEVAEQPEKPEQDPKHP